MEKGNFLMMYEWLAMGGFVELVTHPKGKGTFNLKIHEVINIINLIRGRGQGRRGW